MVSISTMEVSPAERLRGVLPDIEIVMLGPVIEEIEQLKRQRNAVVLAHNYMTPDIYHGVADLKGDSLALARMAGETDSDVIVMAGRDGQQEKHKPYDCTRQGGDQYHKG